jgi:fructose transport system ATP-binding protein
MAEQNNKPQTVLEARGLVKHYEHVVALDGTDFELYPGEILAVIGDNGAGKSTLIKALSGALQSDSGEIFLHGQRIRFSSPSDARRQGIETVYRSLAVAPSMNIYENLFLGRELCRPNMFGSQFRLLDKRRMLQEAQPICRRLSSTFSR